MEVSIRGEMTVQFEAVNPATLELKKSKVRLLLLFIFSRKTSLKLPINRRIVGKYEEVLKKMRFEHLHLLPSGKAIYSIRFPLLGRPRWPWHASSTVRYYLYGYAAPVADCVLF